MKNQSAFRKFFTIALFVIVSALSPNALAQHTPTSPSKDLPEAMDKMLADVYKPDSPGAAVIVVKDGKVLFRKGYGLADIELNVPIKPEMVFRLGSVTKQFTAVAVLMLAEQGKLSVGDDITKYLPNFPTGGKKITIEHLLTHTSGIKSYTSLPKWPPMMRKDMTVEELIDLFKNEPLDFEPGTKWDYSNSGYILLGAIIEKVSGKSYETFIEENIFQPLDMKHSYYGSNEPLIPNRVSGYEKRGDKFTNAPYLSMTQPYAAGSLMSSVDDLALWDAALASDKLLKPASKQRMFAAYKLSNGESTHYGYGWGIEEYEGRPVIGHGGGINGFVTNVVRYPEDHVYVALLSNATPPEVNPEYLANKLGALAIGKPYKEQVAVKLDPKILDSYVGVYQVDNTGFRTITKEGDRLFSQRSGGAKLEIWPESETDFFVKNSLVHLSFRKDASGKVTGMIMYQEDGSKGEAARTDKPLPKEHQAIRLDGKVFDAYVGDYELAPSFVITISRDGGKFMAQATGQPEFEIFPESETNFFLTVVDAQMTFVKDAQGKVTQLVLHQAGQDVPGKKIK